MSEDVYCVQAYQMIRKGAGQNARRLSVGRNLYPLSSALQRSLGVLMQNIIESGRLSEYESVADERDKELVAELLRQYLGRPDIKACDLFFTNGSQEAISMICGYGADAQLAALLPLPHYYAYEQSSVRWGMPIAGYYGVDGVASWAGETPDRLLQVLILPNPVTGSLFKVPQVQRSSGKLDADFTVIDCVYQLGAFDGPSGLGDVTRELCRTVPFGKLALLFTVSKDLSLPGLRAGVIVSGNRDLLRYAKADRFERYYSISPLIGQTLALYLSLLLLNEARAHYSVYASRYENLRVAFLEAGVPFPGEEDFESMLSHFDAMVVNCKENLVLVQNARTVLALEKGWLPFAGYSVFPRLLCDFKDSADFLSWTNLAATEYGLKLNPSYIFGATPDIWDDLYPEQYNIRVNISDNMEDLRIALERLAQATEHVAPGHRRRRIAS